MNSTGSHVATTVTDPIWVDVVVAALIVFTALTVAVILHAAAVALVRRWRDAQALVDQRLAVGLADIDAARWEHELQTGGSR